MLLCHWASPHIWLATVVGPAVSDVTRILNAIQEGDARAADQLLPILYKELRSLADLPPENCTKMNESF